MNMKNLMKATAIILSAAMMLSMTACGQKMDPKTVYDTSVKKNADLKDLDLDSISTTKIKQNDTTLDVKATMNIKAKDMNTDKMELLMEGNTSIKGEEIKSTIFYKDGYFYSDTQGQKTKYHMDLSGIMDVLKKNNANITSTNMTKISMKNDGKNNVITYTINPSSLNSMIMDSMSKLGRTASELKEVKFDVKSANGECTINKEGYYTDVKMTMIYDMTLNGITLSIEANTDGVVHDPGKAVNFTLPDTDNYKEIPNPAETSATSK